MDLNNAFSELGSFGLYQLYVYIISCIPVINAGIIMLSPVFISASPKHRCFVPNCDTSPEPQYFQSYIDYSIPKIFGSIAYDSCYRFQQINKNETTNQCVRDWFTNTTETCDSYIFDSNEFQSTVASEFNKVCGNSWKIRFSQSLFYFGVLSGAFFFGAFADRYGRKAVFVVAPVIAYLTCLISSFSPDFLVFTISSAVTAAAAAGMYQTAFIIGIEFIGGKWRVWCGNIHSILFAIGAAILCLLAYYIRDWRSLQFAISIPIAITLCYPWIFPESVRWQVSNGQTYKAIQTIRTAAKWNRVTISEEYICPTETCSQYVNPSESQSDGRVYGPLDLLRHPITRVWALYLFFIWFTNSLVYYGLSLQSSNIGSNIYLTFGWLSLAEIPAILLSTTAMQIFGRKKVLCFLLVFGGISCIIPMFLSESYTNLITVLAVLGRSYISASFALIYVYSVEIFPTVLRSSGLGMCSMSSRVGGIFAPYLIELSVFGKFFPLLISGIVAIIAGLLVTKLPETHNRKLPDTLEDVEALKNSNRAVKKLSHSLEQTKEEKTKLLYDNQS